MNFAMNFCMAIVNLESLRGIPTVRLFVVDFNVFDSVTLLASESLLEV